MKRATFQRHEELSRRLSRALAPSPPFLIFVRAPSPDCTLWEVDDVQGLSQNCRLTKTPLSDVLHSDPETPLVSRPGLLSDLRTLINTHKDRHVPITEPGNPAARSWQ